MLPRDQCLYDLSTLDTLKDSANILAAHSASNHLIHTVRCGVEVAGTSNPTSLVSEQALVS